MRNPIILPKDATIPTLIILEHYKVVGHIIRKTILKNIRLKYWPVVGDNK